MGQHANLGASNASIWLKCAPAGRDMRNVKGVSGTSIHAATGTVAHTLSELALMFGDEILEYKHGDVITVEKFDIPITEDMVKAVKVYTKYANEIIEKSDSHSLEVRVSLNDLYKIHGIPKAEELFGTADLIAFCQADDLVDIADYKHGAGVPVEADTPQGKYYALGVLLALMLKGVSPSRFRVSIVQPRAPHPDGPIRTVEYSRQELVAFGKEIMEAVNNIVTGQGGYVSGQHCRFCPMSATCPKLFEEHLALAAGDFKVSTNELVIDGKSNPSRNMNQYIDAGPLSETELAFILDRRDIFRRWLDKIEQEAMSRLHQSKTVPGWKLVAKRARNEWVSKDISTIMGLAKQHTTIPGPSALVVESLLSPAQAKKAMSPGAWDEFIKAGIIRNASTGVTLAPASDKRPEISTNDAARKDFEVAPDDEAEDD